MTAQPNGITGDPPRRATALRDAFAHDQLLTVAGAHDGLTALLAEEAGFDAVWASGLGISAAHGLPDISLLGLAEFLGSATVMHNSVAVPIIADCDTGYGDAPNAAFTMSRFESAGIAAVCIEDKVFPKRNSFSGSGQELLGVDEFCQKLIAAKGAQQYSETVLIARTEAFVCGFPVDEAIGRCHRYVDAGADAVLVHSKSADSGEVISFMRKWGRRAPVVLVPTTYSDFSIDEAKEAGVSIVIYANCALRASVRAIRDVWRAVLVDGCCARVEPTMATIREILDLSGIDKWLGTPK